ncbi:mitochondrial carrier domain-containing protein, partial [Gorgonomyces haynaldii]
MNVKKKNPSLHLLAGATSGLISCTLLQPLDLIKTRLQQDNLKSQRRIYSAVEQVYRSNGVAGFWKGTVPTLWRNVPGSGLYFLTLNELKQRLTWLPQDVRHFVSGSVARVSVGLMMMPITVVKVRMESNLYQYQGVYGSLQSIIKQDGVRGLFSGWGVTALRDAPFAGIYVFFYEHMKHLSSGNTPFNNMLAGLSSGLMATIVTQPFDVAKTRIQLKPKEYPNMFSSIVRIISQEGILGCFKGASPRVLRKSLSSAISWVVYEEIIKQFNH